MDRLGGTELSVYSASSSPAGAAAAAAPTSLSNRVVMSVSVAARTASRSYSVHESTRRMEEAASLLPARGSFVALNRDHSILLASNRDADSAAHDPQVGDIAAPLLGLQADRYSLCMCSLFLSCFLSFIN